MKEKMFVIPESLVLHMGKILDELPSKTSRRVLNMLESLPVFEEVKEEDPKKPNAKQKKVKEDENKPTA
jgi:hypothetical protein